MHLYSRSSVSMIKKLSYPYSQFLVYGLRGIPTNYTLIIMRPHIDSCKIEVNMYLSVNFDLSVKVYNNGVNLSISIVTLRQIDTVLNEIFIPTSKPIISEDYSTKFNKTSHIASEESLIRQTIDNMYKFDLMMTWFLVLKSVYSLSSPR